MGSWECHIAQCIFFDQSPTQSSSTREIISGINYKFAKFPLSPRLSCLSAITVHSEDWLMMEFWKFLTEGKGLLLPEELELPPVDMVKIGKKVSEQVSQAFYDTSNFNFVSNDQIGQEKDVEFEVASSVVESGGLGLATADFKIGAMAESNSVGVQDGESSKDAVTLSSSMPSMTTKRAQLPSLYTQPPTCQVHGCNKDLSSFKGYYKRHKVCDAHTKTAQVIVKGIEQRFCQQCSRFHLLAEFDDEKRSCRKRLANHNERRRKPQGNRLLSSSLTRRTSFLFQETPPTAFSGPSKHETGKWFGHMKLEDPNLDSTSLLNFHDNISLGALDETVSITMARDQKISHFPDSSCALSLLSSQSQNASDHLLETTVGPTATDASNHLGTSKHCTSSGQGTMVDLLQLSSHLQIVEKKRKLMR